MDPAEIERLCNAHAPDLLYVIHCVGWPQPMTALMALARRRGMLVVEDCALSLLSSSGGTPLGAFGDWAVFCLYKTLPLPNGSLLVQNTTTLPGLDRVATRQAGSAAVLGKTAELMVQRIRSRANGVGAALYAVKRGMGRAASALDVERPNVGDIGFNLDDVDLAMSPLAHRLLDRLDFETIRRRRLDNYRLLDALLPPEVERVFPNAPDGCCPLFFPIVVADKHATALALQQAGVDALEFWNESMESGEEMGPDARFLRRHVLELPIHQDLTPRQISYVAQQVSILNCRAAA
jgi:dTDP-4-amino-4,6-dideoxygalactose transaminase